MGTGQAACKNQGYPSFCISQEEAKELEALVFVGKCIILFIAIGAIGIAGLYLGFHYLNLGRYWPPLSLLEIFIPVLFLAAYCFSAYFFFIRESKAKKPADEKKKHGVSFFLEIGAITLVIMFVPIKTVGWYFGLHYLNLGRYHPFLGWSEYVIPALLVGCSVAGYFHFRKKRKARITMGTAGVAEATPDVLGKSYGYVYDDEEEEHDCAPFAIICLIFLAIVAIVSLAAAIGLHFLLLYLGWRDGLPFLVPAFFLYVCFEFYNHNPEILEAEDEEDSDD